MRPKAPSPGAVEGVRVDVLLDVGGVHQIVGVAGDVIAAPGGRGQDRKQRNGEDGQQRDRRAGAGRLFGGGLRLVARPEEGEAAGGRCDDGVERGEGVQAPVELEDEQARRRRQRHAEQEGDSDSLGQVRPARLEEGALEQPAGQHRPDQEGDEHRRVSRQDGEDAGVEDKR